MWCSKNTNTATKSLKTRDDYIVIPPESVFRHRVKDSGSLSGIEACGIWQVLAHLMKTTADMI